MAQTYLFNRSSKFYFRMRVPRDLKNWFQTWVIQKALNTWKVSEAKLPLAGWVQKTGELFTVLRSSLLSQSIRKKSVDNFMSTHLSRGVVFNASNEIGEDNFRRARECGKNYTREMKMNSVLKAPVRGRAVVKECVGTDNENSRPAVGISYHSAPAPQGGAMDPASWNDMVERNRAENQNDSTENEDSLEDTADELFDGLENALDDL